jgi:hypothetical protein
VAGAERFAIRQTYEVGQREFRTLSGQFALGPVIVPAKNLLVLGMGAAGSIQASRAVAPELEIDAVEIDRSGAHSRRVLDCRRMTRSCTYSGCAAVAGGT